jgi:cell wall-associated NlpC family hydrolase
VRRIGSTFLACAGSLRTKRFRRGILTVAAAGLAVQVASGPSVAQPQPLLARSLAMDTLTSPWTPTAGNTGDAISATPAAASGDSPAQVAAMSYTTAGAGSSARIAIAYARAQLGLPYQWGGDGPAKGDAGFDCSGLTHAAYEAAAVSLPRTAQTQYDAGPRVGPASGLQPGDLVFYGTPVRVHHVGLFIGGGQMINAPTFGQPVQIASYRWLGDDYLGATRPSAAPDRFGAGIGSSVPALQRAQVAPLASPSPSPSAKPAPTPTPTPTPSPSPSPTPTPAPSPTPSPSPTCPSPSPDPSPNSPSPSPDPSPTCPPPSPDPSPSPSLVGSAAPAPSPAS